MNGCVWPDCPGHDSLLETILHGQHHITQRLGRIEVALSQLGEAMTNIDDELNTLETDVDVLSADETRELADLEALKAAGQTLTPEQQARFDALDAKVKADTAAIDTADPAPPAV